MATATSTNNSWQELLGNVQQTMADDSHTASQITQYCSRVGVAEIVVYSYQRTLNTETLIPTIYNYFY